MERLRKIRIAYVLGVLGAAAAAVAVVSTLGGGSDKHPSTPTPPQHVDIGGGTGPRSCVVRSVPATATRTLSDKETSTARAPVRVTVTTKGTLGESKAEISTTVRQRATVTGTVRVTVKVKGRGAVC